MRARSEMHGEIPRRRLLAPVHRRFGVRRSLPRDEHHERRARALRRYGQVRGVNVGSGRGGWVKSKSCVMSTVFLSRSVNAGSV